MKWWRAIEAYAGSNDPLGRMANLIALCIVGNQPIYPLYVWWCLGHWDSQVLLLWITTPLFALVPWAGRRDVRAGKLLMCLAGIANTALAVLLLGRDSGVGLFFVPCALLCVLLLDRWLGWVLALGTLGLGFWLDAIARVSLPQLFRMNALSVGTLLCFITFLYVRARRSAVVRDPN